LKAQRKTLQKDAEIAGVAFEESGRNEQLYAELGAEDAIFADTIVIELQRLMHKKGKKYDLYMSENDVVKLPKQQNTVSIKGEINNTLIINYTGRKLKPYLRDAGGTTKLADKRRVFVVEPNGKARSTKRFLGMRAYPKVMPGSVVVVPPKIIKEDGPADPAQIAAASSIIASTSSLLFIIITLLR
jgi:protein involved in polysaccharide export with SLBB domain